VPGQDRRVASDLHLDPVALAAVAVTCRALAEDLASVCPAEAPASAELERVHRVLRAAACELGGVGAAAAAAVTAALASDAAATGDLERIRSAAAAWTGPMPS
jgi:hypothetical protein